jgi:hypothetical protein
MHRHNYWSHELSKLHSKFIETSRFEKSAPALLQYSPLAELLYKPDNKTDVENKHPDLFDVYKATVPEYLNKEYTLILYKGTKIVHTLFPNEAAKNKAKKKFRRGEMIVKEHDNNTTVAVVPYYDSENVARYGFHIQFLEKENIEKLTILVYENDIATKVVKLKDQIHDETFVLFNRLNEIRYNKLLNVENVIELIDKGTIK